MEKKTTVGQKLGYLILAVLPAIMMEACLFVGQYAKQLQIGSEYIKQHGMPTTNEAALEYSNYIAERFTGDTVMLVAAMGQTLALVLGILILFRVLKTNAFGNPVKAFKGLRIPGILLASVGAELMLSCALTIISLIAPKALEAYGEMISSSGLAGLTLISTIATILIAPICEEVIFRGLTMKILEKTGWNFWIVNCLQALIFGVAHMNLVQGIYAFILGMFLGYVAKKCNSLWGSILAHAAFNFSGTYLVTLIFGTEDKVPTLKLILIGIVAIAVFTLGIAVFTKEKKGEVVNE